MARQHPELWSISYAPQMIRKVSGGGTASARYLNIIQFKVAGTAFELPLPAQTSQADFSAEAINAYLVNAAAVFGAAGLPNCSVSLLKTPSADQIRMALSPGNPNAPTTWAPDLLVTVEASSLAAGLGGETYDNFAAAYVKWPVQSALAPVPIVQVDAPETVTPAPAAISAVDSASLQASFADLRGRVDSLSGTLVGVAAALEAIQKQIAQPVVVPQISALQADLAVVNSSIGAVGDAVVSNAVPRNTRLLESGLIALAAGLATRPGKPRPPKEGGNV